MTKTTELTWKRLNWDAVPKIWAEHFERMKNDPEYAEQVRKEAEDDK